jgi:hypothetical protein
VPSTQQVTRFRIYVPPRFFAGFVVFTSLEQIPLWLSFYSLGARDRHGVHASWGVWQVLGVVQAGAILVFAGLPRRNHIGWLLLALGAELSFIINFFAARYWDIGTTHNFTEALTPLDATYFALGIFTTPALVQSGPCHRLRGPGRRVR